MKCNAPTMLLLSIKGGSDSKSWARMNKKQIFKNSPKVVNTGIQYWQNAQANIPKCKCVKIFENMTINATNGQHRAGFLWWVEQR